MEISAAYNFDVDDLIMSATAYYIGRRTISVTDFCERMCLSWGSLPKNVQVYVRLVVEEALLREQSGDANAFGHSCDHEAWMKVRRLWCEDIHRVVQR